MEIQTASVLDLAALRRLEHACFAVDAWSLLDLIAVLSLPDVIRLKAVELDQMIGFVAGETSRSREAAWISTIAVDPGFQRRGIGRALLRACETRLRSAKVKLTVRVSNDGAISLYEREGYRTLEIWPHYYKDGEDGLVMAKDL